MEEIYVNVESVCGKSVKPRPSTSQTGKNVQADGEANSERRFYGVVLCQGLLIICLLAALIGLGVYYHDSVQRSAAELSNITAELTERLQANENKSASLTEEKRLLNASLAEVAKKLNRLSKTCPSGWWMFSSTCYFFSTVSDSWEKGRQDCRDRGADLVMIDSHDEQESLSKIIKQNTWIGLNDRDNENTWKWSDETPLTLTYWEEKQPDNGGGNPVYGEEDCVQLKHFLKPEENWNDLNCDKKLQWICEF